MADAKTSRAMAALFTMAEIWATKFQAAGMNLRSSVRVMLACPDAEDRILELIKQAHVEGLYDGFKAGWNSPRPANGVTPCVRCAATEPRTGTCDGQGPLCADGVKGTQASSHKLLDHGDVVQRGDEVLADDAVNWLPLVGWEVGMKWGCNFMPMRRPAGVKEDGNA